MTSEVFLIGDIGGTNARFALVNAGASTYHDERVLQIVEGEREICFKQCSSPLHSKRIIAAKPANMKPEVCSKMITTFKRRRVNLQPAFDRDVHNVIAGLARL